MGQEQKWRTEDCFEQAIKRWRGWAAFRLGRFIYLQLAERSQLVYIDIELARAIENSDRSEAVHAAADSIAG